MIMREERKQDRIWRSLDKSLNTHTRARTLTQHSGVLAVLFVRFYPRPPPPDRGWIRMSGTSAGIAFPSIPRDLVAIASRSPLES